MTTINLTASEFAALIRPVLPLAGDDMMLPVLNAVLIETDSKWLSATATDRFRLGIKRIEKRPTEDDEAADWPEFRALIPLRAVRSLLAMFKASRGYNPSMSLTIEGDKLIAEGTGGFSLFDASRFTHQLENGEYPKVRGIFRECLAVKPEDRRGDFGINPSFMADFKATGATTLRVMGGSGEVGSGAGIVITDDDGFIGLLMPRRLVNAGGFEDWTDFLAVKPKPVAKPARKKPAAKKATAA